MNENFEAQENFLEAAFEAVYDKPQFCLDETFLVKSSEISDRARMKGNEIYSNKTHDSMAHMAIFTYYSKSIACAPNNSEKLALAYGNRSAILFHLKKYKECLIDIERACEITCSEKLKDKLLCRKMKCLSLSDSSDESDENSQQGNLDEAELLRFIPSREIPCAAESVSLKYNERYGRNFVANRDIKPGEIIMKEKSYVTIPFINVKYYSCNYCLNFAWNGIPCDGCAVVIYCSEKCKNEAWQEYHDIECPVLPYFVSFRLNDMSRMDIEIKAAALRLFIKAVKKESLDTVLSDVNLIDNSADLQLEGFFQDNIFQSHKFRSFYNLLSCNEEEDSKLVFSGVVKILFKLSNFNKLTNIKDPEEIKKFKCFLIKLLMKFEKKINLNLYMESMYGITVNPCFSLLNHSCYPNAAVVLTKNPEIVVYALRPIEKKSQIFVNYVCTDLTPRDIRQKVIQKTYNFTCRCQPCREFWPSKFENPTLAEQEANNALFDLSSLVKNISTSLHYFDKNPVEDWPRDKKTLSTIKKLLILISKHLTGCKAYLASQIFSDYIQIVFNSISLSNSEMPSTC